MERIGCPGFAIEFLSWKKLLKKHIKKASLTLDILVKIMQYHLILVLDLHEKLRYFHSNLISRCTDELI